MNSHEDNCIFCKIIKGDIPCAKVYEDDNVFAFLDIGQVTKGHTLVIPKIHKKDIFELTPEISRSLFQVVPHIATSIQQTYQPVGLNILNNNGETAGQSVFHFHMHLIPRYGNNDGFSAVWNTNEYTSEQLQILAEEIRNNLQ